VAKETRDLPDRLVDVREAAHDLERLEREMLAARKQFRIALVAANKAGASRGLLGRVVGLSRQRVSAIIDTPKRKTLPPVGEIGPGQGNNEPTADAD
jgi:hypothetical protein